MATWAGVTEEHSSADAMRDGALHIRGVDRNVKSRVHSDVLSSRVAKYC